MNEAETRAEHIDPALKAAGWGVVEGSRVLREYSITLGRLQGGGGKGGQSLRAKAEIADYVLVYRNTKLAVIEAKAWDKPLTEGVGRSRITRASCRSASLTPATDKASTPSTCIPASKRNWRNIRRRRNCGSAPSRLAMSGAIASPPYRSRIAAASSRAATISDRERWRARRATPA